MERTEDTKRGRRKKIMEMMKERKEVGAIVCKC
jgi:hypothetical protein